MPGRHKDPRLQAQRDHHLVRGPRGSHLHFTPTSSSWLNLVQRFFPDLIASIETYLRVDNKHPKPLIWTATAESIISKVHRGRLALQQVDSQI